MIRSKFGRLNYLLRKNTANLVPKTANKSGYIKGANIYWFNLWLCTANVIVSVHLPRIHTFHAPKSQTRCIFKRKKITFRPINLNRAYQSTTLTRQTTCVSIWERSAKTEQANTNNSISVKFVIPSSINFCHSEWKVIFAQECIFAVESDYFRVPRSVPRVIHQHRS